LRGRELSLNFELWPKKRLSLTFGTWMPIYPILCKTPLSLTWLYSMPHKKIEDGLPLECAEVCWKVSTSLALLFLIHRLLWKPIGCVNMITKKRKQSSNADTPKEFLRFINRKGWTELIAETKIQVKEKKAPKIQHGESFSDFWSLNLEYIGTDG